MVLMCRLPSCLCLPHPSLFLPPSPFTLTHPPSPLPVFSDFSPFTSPPTPPHSLLPHPFPPSTSPWPSPSLSHPFSFTSSTSLSPFTSSPSHFLTLSPLTSSPSPSLPHPSLPHPHSHSLTPHFLSISLPLFSADIPECSPSHTHS